MKSKLLFLLLSRRDPKGFAIAFALTLGAVMVLVGISLMVHSTQDKTNAEAVQINAEGLSLAEVGVTRFQDILNKNRYVALYNDCESGRNVNGVCQDGTGSQSWAKITTVPKIIACQTSSATNIQDVAYDQKWVNVPGKGQYRLISYQFQPKDTAQAPHTAPGKGILTLEGQVKANNKLQVATSRLVVEIPVKESPPETDGIPGVWLLSGGTGNNTIQGDVLLNDCNTNPTSITVTGTDPVSGTAYTAKNTALEFPNLPSKPSTPHLGTLSGQDYEFPRKDSSGTITDTPITKTIKDKDGNVIQSYDIYQYVIDKIDLQSGNHEITITPGYRVNFYLNGSIEKGTEIRHSCTNSSGNPITGCKPTNFQIYGYGTAPLASNDSYKICTIGNDKLEAFIFAPQYSVGTAGTGGGQGGIKGSVWAKTWSTDASCGSQTSNVVVTQTGRWEDLGLVPRNMPPKIASISAWNRLER